MGPPASSDVAPPPSPGELRSRELEQALLRLEQSYEETLHALTLALDAREQETACHSHRVALWTLFFSLGLGVPEADLVTIHRGALLHDIGKIGIPDPILLKSAELTPQEWAVMRTHPRIGRDLLMQITQLRAAADIPWSHHERWDGKGYPRGLAGREIGLGARIFAIVDVYDALRSARPYKAAMGHDAAIAIVRGEAGTHLDPDLVQHFVAHPESVWCELTAPALATMSYRELLALARSVFDRFTPRTRSSRPSTT